MRPWPREIPICRRFVALSAFFLLSFSIQGPAAAVSTEDSNTCETTQDDPCLRTGSCGIQGATWPQSVTIDRSDIFDTQGWAGVCDMVHVALVRGRCEPPGASVDVVAFLSETSFASISEIVGPLTCAGDPEPPLPSVPALGLVGSGALALTIAAFGWAARRRAGGRGAGPCASRWAAQTAGGAPRKATSRPRTTVPQPITTTPKPMPPSTNQRSTPERSSSCSRE